MKAINVLVKFYCFWTENSSLFIFWWKRTSRAAAGASFCWQLTAALCSLPFSFFSFHFVFIHLIFGGQNMASHHSKNFHKELSRIHRT